MFKVGDKILMKVPPDMKATHHPYNKVWTVVSVVEGGPSTPTRYTVYNEEKPKDSHWLVPENCAMQARNGIERAVRCLKRK